jgi:hypothetical protein
LAGEISDEEPALPEFGDDAIVYLASMLNVSVR